MGRAGRLLVCLLLAVLAAVAEGQEAEPADTLPLAGEEEARTDDPGVGDVELATVTREPGADVPGADVPGAEPGAQEPGAEEPGADVPGAEEPGAEPKADVPGAEPGAEEPGADVPGAEPGADVPGAEPGAQEPGAEGAPGGDAEMPAAANMTRVPQLLEATQTNLRVRLCGLTECAKVAFQIRPSAGAGCEESLERDWHVDSTIEMVRSKECVDSLIDFLSNGTEYAVAAKVWWGKGEHEWALSELACLETCAGPPPAVAQLSVQAGERAGRPRLRWHPPADACAGSRYGYEVMARAEGADGAWGDWLPALAPARGGLAPRARNCSGGLHCLTLRRACSAVKVRVLRGTDEYSEPVEAVCPEAAASESDGGSLYWYLSGLIVVPIGVIAYFMLRGCGQQKRRDDDNESQKPARGSLRPDVLARSDSARRPLPPRPLETAPVPASPSTLLPRLADDYSEVRGAKDSWGLPRRGSARSEGEYMEIPDPDGTSAEAKAKEAWLPGRWREDDERPRYVTGGLASKWAYMGSSLGPPPAKDSAYSEVVAVKVEDSDESDYAEVADAEDRCVADTLRV